MGFFMLEKWIVSIVISFVLRQVEKFKDQTDWVKVRADLETRVKDLVPGTWFDAEAVALVDMVLDKIQSVLGSTADLESLLRLIAAEDWAGALAFIKDLLLKALPLASKASLAVAAI